MYLIRAMRARSNDIIEVAVGTIEEYFSVAYIFDTSKEIKSFILVDHEPEEFGWVGYGGWKKIRKGCFSQEDYKYE